MENKSQPQWQISEVEFEERANEIYEQFLESLSPKFTIDLSEGEEGDEWDTHRSEGFQFVYTQRGSKLAREMARRLYKVAYKYFPTHNIEISSHLFREL